MNSNWWHPIIVGLCGIGQLLVWTVDLFVGMAVILLASALAGTYWTLFWTLYWRERREEKYKMSELQARAKELADEIAEGRSQVFTRHLNLARTTLSATIPVSTPQTPWGVYRSTEGREVLDTGDHLEAETEVGLTGYRYYSFNWHDQVKEGWTPILSGAVEDWKERSKTMNRHATAFSTYEDPAHTYPARRCHCGIYVLKEAGIFRNKELAHEMTYGYPYSTRDNALSCLVIAKVAMSGLVVEHEYGYRAQSARMDELILVPMRTVYNATAPAREYSIPLVPSIWVWRPYSFHVVDFLSKDVVRAPIAALESRYGIPARVITSEEIEKWLTLGYLSV